MLIFENETLMVEKPLVINSKHVNLVKKLCKKNKVCLSTAYYRRYLKRFKYIKRILDKKKIGKVIYFRITLTHSPDKHPTAPINIKKIKKKNISWRFNKKISGGGNFLDMGSHAIDLIIFLLGNIKKIDSIKKNYTNYYNVEDTLLTNIELNNGVVGQGTWSSITDKNIDNFEIFGTKGYIKFSMSFSNLVELHFKNRKIRKFISFEKPFHKNIINHVIKKFSKKIKYKNFDIEENGLKVADLQIKALR